MTGQSFTYYWWQATDKWRHAYRGRRDGQEIDRSICGKQVDLTCAPLSEFFPSCMECWRLIKQLRGDSDFPQGWLTSTVTTARQPGA